MGEAPEESSRCGVAKLKGDGESTKLPYTMMGGTKWVPLAYFEGEVGWSEFSARIFILHQ